MIHKVTSSSKMEVESRVSVQAMRGKFEQKQLETPTPCIRSPPSKSVTSPYRPRTSSLIAKEKLNSGHNGVQSEINVSLNSVDKENDCSSKSVKQSPRNISKTKSIISDIVSPILSGSKVTKALTPKKHSVENIKSVKVTLENGDGSKDAMKATPRRKLSETLDSETKPSVVRRIPVFKSFNGGPGSDERNGIRNQTGANVADTTSRREKFFGHIRSRSHGNFMIKRDSSSERNGGLLLSPENGGTNYFEKKYRQRSSDNLFSDRDAKSSSPFEGKQKIVANVVKNMKDRPKVLRKFSFSSKVEKDLKNKKEKATPNKEPDKHSPSVDPSTAKMEALAKVTVKEMHSSVISSVSLAKAVADIALVKSSSRSPESVTKSKPEKISRSPPLNTKNNSEKNLSSSPESVGKSDSSSEEASPPSRPPRRRSGTLGLFPHKKGMAPSPPGQSFNQSPNNSEGDMPENSSVELRAKSVEQKPSPDNHKLWNPSSPSKRKSRDSLTIPPSFEISKEITPGSDLVNRDDASLHKNNKSTIQADKSSEEYCTCDEEKTSVSAKITADTKLENNKADNLPSGPPPKKPPRTFAYDIYKSSKESKCEVNSKSTETLVNSNEKLNLSNPNVGPIYAIPQKKKKTENLCTPKPPVRSNSDLTKRDLLTKPSVAPKPAHILKAVRTSVVDPLSCAEKGEEAAMTTEFQRQAHIRYSLRRPKKPPPAPPSTSESEGGTHNGHADANISTKDNTSLNKNHSNVDKKYGSTPLIIKDGSYSPENSLDFTLESRPSPNSIYESVTSDDSDINTPAFRITSRSSYNLHVPSAYESDQPLSLGHCPTNITPELTGLYRKRSMSDETLYKGSKCAEEPIYAMPIFANGKGSRGHNRQRELHYMCSVLFTNEEADAGRDGCGSGRKNSKDGDTPDRGIKSSIISAWKKEFRQSCRQVQNKIKKSVNR